MGARGTARVCTLTHQSSVTGPLGLGTGDGGGAGTADADSSRPTTSRDSVAPPLEPPIKRPAGTVLPRRRYRGGSVASDADPPSRVSIDPPHPPRPLLPWRLTATILQLRQQARRGRRARSRLNAQQHKPSRRRRRRRATLISRRGCPGPQSAPRSLQEGFT